ncbi:MAG TPA: chemotaxis protein CheW [Anaeromyxobacteraceae bacterium]|nr:chemotaxis protein CheW [Anaeromyxobacteraceae bacterium]
MPDSAEALDAPASTQHLSFTVAGNTYGLPVLQVKEILQYEGETRVPGTPPSVRGVVNVRGAVVPLVDLGVKFGHPEVAPTSRTCVLVVEAKVAEGALVFGLIADRVNEVMDLDDRDVSPPPDLGTGVPIDYLKGMGKVGKEFVLLVDLDAALSSLEQSRIGQLAASPAAPHQPN